MEGHREIASIVNRATQDILAVEYHGDKVVLKDAYTEEQHGELSVKLLQEIVEDGAAFKVFCYKDELPWE